MDWSEIAAHFQPEGSLRDIYILNASLEDWASVWGILTMGPEPLRFTVDGEVVAPPMLVEEAFRLQANHSVCASYQLGPQLVNCCCFMADEVELDIDPKEVDGLVEAQRLADFMAVLGRATAKEVRLTGEMDPHSIIARYDPVADHVDWVFLAK
ncbi:hypothetical protein TPR58_08530 [Sphingomonas sp. HF-S3]|uniref:Uncharacterized protein n=1 Tax=Sphingomonas rustica TaxID=3103142 RepID=A0ABV0B6I5_9SPHN